MLNKSLNITWCLPAQLNLALLLGSVGPFHACQRHLLAVSSKTQKMLMFWTFSFVLWLWSTIHSHLSLHLSLLLSDFLPCEVFCINLYCVWLLSPGSYTWIRAEFCNSSKEILISIKSNINKRMEGGRKEYNKESFTFIWIFDLQGFNSCYPDIIKTQRVYTISQSLPSLITSCGNVD